MNSQIGEMCIETYKPSPARTLDASGSRIELLRKNFERAPTITDGVLKGTILE